MANSSAVLSMAIVTTTHSCTLAASSGKTTRMPVAASAKPPKMAPILEALRPRSWPSTGTTKVCTSQHDDSSQFTSSRRRIIGLQSKSHARPWVAPGWGDTAGSSRVRCTHSHVIRGKQAKTKKASRKPPRSISSPAVSGPTKFDSAGPIDNQLNIDFSASVFCAERPTWRCKVMAAAPVAPPVISALRHNTGNSGNAQAKAVPLLAINTASPTGRLKP